MTTVIDTTSAGAAGAAATGTRAPLSDLQDKPKGPTEKALVGIFVAVPMLALLAAVPLAWGWGLGWHDVILAVAFYYISGLGISMGFHRYFTHSSFKARTGLRIALGIAGSMAVEGPILNWVADHRRHHKYSDREGDPHSPWRFGDDWKALAKGLAWAHMGWLFDGNHTSEEKFCPDLLADKKISRISALFPVWVAVTLLAPALIGGLWSWSWQGALTAFLLGEPGARRVPAPRDLVHQLDLPHLRQGGVRGQGQVAERELAGDLVFRRVLAQPPPLRPDLRPARRIARAD